MKFMKVRKAAYQTIYSEEDKYTNDDEESSIIGTIS